MPKIAPFRGIRYNPERVNLHDVIVRIEHLSQGLLRHYYRSGNDLLSLILCCKDEDSTIRARKIYYRWLDEGILVKDSQPVIYLYHQEFEHRGKHFVRKGFVAATLIEPYGEGTVLPHEHIFPEGKEYHLRLMKTLQKNFEQVFVIYSDPSGEIDSQIQGFAENDPVLEVEDEYGTVHKVWHISDLNVIRSVAQKMSKITGVIADGHHRYEASLAYRAEMTKLYGSNGSEGFNFRLINFVRAEDPGLLILPTHRLLKGIKQPEFQKFIDDAAEFFHVMPVDVESIETALDRDRDRHAFGVYTRWGSYILRLKDENVMDELCEPSTSKDYRRLDVLILHRLAIEHILKFDGRIGYERYPEKAISAVDSGKFDLAFFLNPTRPSEVLRIAMNGEKMPQKSTDFYPKLVTGLLTLDISPEERVELP